MTLQGCPFLALALEKMIRPVTAPADQQRKHEGFLPTKLYITTLQGDVASDKLSCVSAGRCD